MESFNAKRGAGTSLTAFLQERGNNTRQSLTGTRS